MKSKTKTNEQYAAFENLLKRVVKVPHAEIKAALDAEKEDKKRQRIKRKGKRGANK